MTGFSVQDCQDACPVTDTFRGVTYAPDVLCWCHYDAGTKPSTPPGFNPDDGNVGTGPAELDPDITIPSNCYKYHPAK